MKYYGGREISDEDLERALLLGMSPRERRRLEKKKGVSLKHYADVGLSNKHAGSMVRSRTDDAAEVSNPDGTLGENGSIDLSHATENYPSSRITFADKCVDEGTCDTNEIPSTKNDCGGNGEDVAEKRDLPNGNVLPKHNSKLSLLGHGPHGKRVVDHIMSESGEEGIRQFCQRWRQVFVEALHPKFLPPGWDVMHRYDALSPIPQLWCLD